MVVGIENGRGENEIREFPSLKGEWRETKEREDEKITELGTRDMKEIANCLARDVTKETRKRLEGVKEAGSVLRFWTMSGCLLCLLWEGNYPLTCCGFFFLLSFLLSLSLFPSRLTHYWTAWKLKNSERTREWREHCKRGSEKKGRREGGKEGARKVKTVRNTRREERQQEKVRLGQKGKRRKE